MTVSATHDFNSLGDSRLAGFQSFTQRAAARTCHLILQAAFREGILDGCDFKQEDNQLVWSRDGSMLSVSGQVAGSGDRLKLIYDEWALTLDQFLARLSHLAPEVEPKEWVKLRQEAQEAEKNQAAAYAVAFQRPAPKDYLDFEAWIPEGHNLHPGAKTRQGFTAAEQMEYAPELGGQVDLEWVKVKRSLLQPSGVVPKEFQAEDGDWLIPLHPWQKRNILPRLYARELSSGEIRDAEREPLSCRVCTSFRTVVPDNEAFPILKLSVGSLMTSTERSMSRFTVLQGPQYTKYFEQIAKAAPALFERVVAAPETGGLCWTEEMPEDRSRNFSMLFRERLEMPDGEVWVPCSALPQPSIEGASYFRKFFGVDEVAKESFIAYLELLIPFHLELYQQFGLALEAHLQNCVVKWGETGPEKLWVRDWGGLRADKSKLQEQAPWLLESLDPRSVTLSNAETAEKKLIACLYCNHLTELVAALSWESGLSEEWMWHHVAEVSGKHARGRLADRLLKEPWPVKCLLKMRLGIGGTGDVYHLRENPLACGN